jgi:hypothetical protein
MSVILLRLSSGTQRVFPQLRARAKRSGAKIFFLDEAGVRLIKCSAEPGEFEVRHPRYRRVESGRA